MKLRRLLERCVAGAAIGGLAAVAVIGAEYGLVGGHFSQSTPTLRDSLLLFILLVAMVTWPALAAGAALGVAWPRVAAALRRSAPWRTVAVVTLAAVVLAGTGLGITVPEVLELRLARTALLAVGWVGLWAGLRLAVEPRADRPAIPIRAALPLLLRAAAVVAVLLLWSTAFAAFRLDSAQTTRAAALQHAPISGVLLQQVQQVVDLDGDGYSPVFGGGDCDDHAPSRHPSAVEIAGNAIDEDCDGDDLAMSSVALAAADRVEAARVQGASAAAHATSPSIPAPDPIPSIPQSETPDPWTRPVPRRSVILITVDTLRADYVGALGRTPSPTPHIDAVAADGVVFTNARAQGPMTKASVASMMAGVYFSEVHRSTHAWVKVLPANELLAEHAHDAGYRTVGVASHWYLSDLNGWEQGFDRLHNVARENLDRLWHADHATDLAIIELERLVKEGGVPFLLWLHLLDPHHPYVPHESLSQDDPRGLPGFTPGDTKEERYLAEIIWTDRQVGRVLRWLTAHQIDDEVVVVIHSDHGEGFGEHGYEYHGQSLLDDQLRVPVIIRAPGVPASRIDAPISLLDLNATLVALVEQVPLSEQPVDTATPGRPSSLWPAMYGQPLPERPIFAEMVQDDNHSHQVAVVDDHRKLVHSFTHNTWELYDLTADPGEQRNLYEVEPRESARLRRLLRRFERDGLHPVEPQ